MQTAQLSFQQMWQDQRAEKNTNIVAGVDPLYIHMVGEGEAHIPPSVDKSAWLQSYIEAVAPFCAAVKINQGFFQEEGDRGLVKELIQCAWKHGLLTISDNKVADIGSTNKAWFLANKELGFDAITCAPYAGNIESSIELAEESNLAIFTMGLMSNSEYKTEMNFTNDETGETLWHSRVRRSQEAGAAGVVVGGTYTDKDTCLRECVALTRESGVLYLIPGIGAQGGDAAAFLRSGIDKKCCMVCSSRALMFPEGSNSSSDDQASAAETLRDLFNSNS